MAQIDRDELISILTRYLASGKLDSSYVLPALQALRPKEPPAAPISELLKGLEDQEDEAVSRLVRHLKQAQRADALKHHELRRSGESVPEELRQSLGDLPLDVPLGWKTQEENLVALRTALRHLADRFFVRPRRDGAPTIAAAVDRMYREAVKDTFQSTAVWNTAVVTDLIAELEQMTDEPRPDPDVLGHLKEFAGKKESGEWDPLSLPGRCPEMLPAGVREAEVLETLKGRFAGAATREEKEEIIDLLCSWPTDRTAPVLLELLQEPRLQDRASLVLTLRFGEPPSNVWRDWRDWKRWLQGCERQLRENLEALESLIRERPGELLLLWYSGQQDADSRILQNLEDSSASAVPPVDPDEFLLRWADDRTAAEWGALLASEPSERTKRLLSESPAEAPPAPLEAAPETAGELPPPERAEEEETAAAAREKEKRPAHRAPGFWHEHIRSFFVENWFMVAGMAMVLVGSSLVAYYTWDKHWLVRYTVMPAILAGFTVGLGSLGSWIERRDQRFRGAAATLRGAATGLLPVNFMTVALLSADDQVSGKAVAVPLMGAFYLVFAGAILYRWCASVDRSLGWLLGYTLLLLNALVTLAPLGAVSGVGDQGLFFLLGLGFHVGFLCLAACVVYFTRRVLTPEMADEKIVPWFLGATLVLTYLQVFTWVHLYIQHLPRVYTYAPMVVLTGWLILLVERRTLELHETRQTHGAESFLGFALILLGVLMGAPDPQVRIAVLVLAGVAWLYQSLGRRHPLHYWIALTLMVLGGASAGLLYPGPWIPFLGVGLALGLGAGLQISGWLGQRELREACVGMQAAVLALSTFVALLAQWHYQSQPLTTAFCLLAIAALFAWRAHTEQQLRWVHSTMVILALALPYLGFADVAGQTLEGNTVVLGLAMLSFLWLGLTWLVKRPLILEARSTVLWFYGALAVTAMILRVVIELPRPDPEWYHVAMDYGGPLLMTVVLALATYTSRSLIPALMAIVIMVILLPELKVSLREILENLGWGSGLGSASSALGLVLLCFFLRPLAFLNNLGEGDRFLGRELFPLRRYDHTLFTWPLIAAAVFLLVKVDSWNLARNILGDGVKLKTSIALGVTGVAWTFLAVYHREHRLAILGTHLGWIWLLIGITFAYHELADSPHWTGPPLMTGLVLQGLYFLYRFLLRSRHEWVEDVLAAPTRQALRYGGLVLSLACVIELVVGADSVLVRSGPMMLFLGAQLVWHGLVTRSLVYGSVLFILAWAALLAWTAPGVDRLLARISVEQSLVPTLWLFLAVHALHVGLEFWRGAHRVLEPLLVPFLFAVSLAAILVGFGALVDTLYLPTLTTPQLILILVVLLLTARSHASGPALLLGFLLGYVLVHLPVIRTLDSTMSRFTLLVSPWRASLFALVMAATAHGGSLLYAMRPAWLAGPYSLRLFRSSPFLWLLLPAAGAASLAALYHTVDPLLRESPVQLWTPFLGAGALVLAGLSWRRGAGAFYSAASVLLTLGNIHAVRVSAGEYFLAQGLSQIHLVCLGLAASLLEASLIRVCLRRQLVSVFLNRACLAWAALVLLLLSVNYFVHPNLGEITQLRFVVSGSMAYLAGLYFRRTARRPGRGEEAYVEWLEAFYHFGVTMAIWCAALLIPWLRQPSTALLALGLPVLYFHVRAETGARSRLEEAKRYRNSAVVLGFIILALYVLRSVFHMILFPEQDIQTDYYHYNAPFIMLLGLVLVRLHGLGGTLWLAFYGGLALMVGSFFALTAFPGLSPFEHPMASAWCAVALSHFWTLVSNQRSPLRTAIQRMGNIDGPSWFSLRRSWGVCLLASTQGAVLWGVLDFSSNTRMVAPLLVGAATILIHQGALRKSPVYFGIAAVELVLALHSDFILESYLPKNHVIWAVLGIWAVCLVALELGVGSPKAVPKGAGTLSAAMAGLTLAHVFYHHPSSPVGLWAVALIGLLAACTPTKTRTTSSDGEDLAAALVCCVPAWLVYFSQAPLEEEGIAGATRAWAVLTTTAAVFLTGSFARFFETRLAAAYYELPCERPRLVDRTLSWFCAKGATIQYAVLWATLVGTGSVQLFHYNSVFETAELILLTSLYSAFAVAWFFEGQQRKAMAPYFVQQFCVFAVFVAVRRHLMLTTSFWTEEYDVWTSLAVSACLAGAKQVLDLGRREVRVPLVGTLFTLPAVALAWVLIHDLGSNVALLVVGLHGLMFAYMGKDDRESPYNVVATAAFVAFVILVFWSKLELRVITAYVVPVGLGILVLLQLFRQRIAAQTRNQIRLVTLLAMLGSAGYYALADDRFPLAYILTFGVLCLLAMGLGGFLRIRLYIALGFTGLIVDLGAIFYRVLVGMERGPRMSVIGSSILLVGAALVFGAIYYKTHKADLDDRLEHWRRLLGEWE